MAVEYDNKIEGKLDVIAQRLGKIDVTLGAQHVSIKDHMRRTEILEDVAEEHKRDLWMQKGALALIVLLFAAAELMHYVSIRH